MKTSHWQSFLILATSTALMAIGAGIATADSPFRGPAAEIIGVEPGSEKAQIVARMQADYEAALRQPRAPELGRPVEQWVPIIEPGVQELDDQRMVPGHPDLEISNWWQAAVMDQSGRLDQAYVGREHGQPVLVMVSLDVMGGTARVTAEIALGPASGTPRFRPGRNDIVEIEDATGVRWRLDVHARSLQAAP